MYKEKLNYRWRKNIYLSFYKSSVGLIKIKITEKYIVLVRITRSREDVENQNKFAKLCGTQLKEDFMKNYKNYFSNKIKWYRVSDNSME